MSDITWHPGHVGRDARRGGRLHEGATVWLTGLSGSGKSTVATELERLLVERGAACYLLDGDNLRHGLNSDLGFSADDRAENVRRVGEVARLFADAGVVAVAPLISPYAAGRAHARGVHEAVGLTFLEVWVSTSLEECERRDPKGLYAKARRGELKGFTGIDDPYEPPEQPDLVLDGTLEATDSARLVLGLLDERGAIPG